MRAQDKDNKTLPDKLRQFFRINKGKSVNTKFRFTYLIIATAIEFVQF